MTTLPQTSPMRLPRPSPSHLAIPSANGHPGPGAAHPVTPGLTGQDIWRVIRANLWLIIGLMILAGVAGYFINMWLMMKYPRFTSTALIEVHTLGELPPVGDEARIIMADPGPASIEVEQQSQASMITNRYFLGNLLQEEDSPIRKTTWFKQWGTHTDQAKEDLQARLEVAPKPNTRLLGVSMSTNSPLDSVAIVREIVKRHIEARTERMQELEINRQKDLQDTIDGYDRRIHVLRDQIQTQDDVLAQYFTADNGMSGLDHQLVLQIQAEAEASKAYMEAAAEQASFVRQINSNMTPLELSEELARSGAMVNQQRIDAFEEQVAYLQGSLGADNPRVKNAQKQLSEMRAKLEDRDANQRASIISSLQERHDTRVQLAKQRMELAKTLLDKVKKDETEKTRALIELERLKGEDRNLRDMVQKARQQKQGLELAIRSKSWSTASLLSEADMPDSPSFPKLPITMTLAIALGLMLSLGIAFLREFMDTSVRSPRDIAKVGQLNLLGMIPHEADDPEAQGARLPLAIYEAPTSIIAEQFRQVRTRLQHSASLDTVRSLLITGTAPGDGKTTVACNLAAGLALNGRRILLVDANFRRPQVHAVLNIPNETGFGDVLNSLDLFDSAVRETEIPNLSVLPTGVKPANSTELLESQLLIDFIERALEEYDHVIFDSGPLLLVSETAALAPRVDGVVTVVRARGNSRGMLQRLRDQLRQLKAENLGVILNAVRSTSGGYYAPMIKSYYAYQNG